MTDMEFDKIRLSQLQQQIDKFSKRWASQTTHSKSLHPQKTRYDELNSVVKKHS